MIHEAIKLPSLVISLKRLRGDLVQYILYTAKPTKEQCYFAYKYLKYKPILDRFLQSHKGPTALPYLSSLIGPNDKLVDHLIKHTYRNAIIRYLKYVDDDERLWKYLASLPKAARFQYEYCYHVKDRPEMRDALVNSKSSDAAGWQISYLACINRDPKIINKLFATADSDTIAQVYNRVPSLRQDPTFKELITSIPNNTIFAYRRQAYITLDELKQAILSWNNPKYLFEYSRMVGDDRTVAKALAQCKDASEYHFSYCYYIKDRKMLWLALANDKDMYSARYQYKYCLDIKDRKIVWQALANNKASNAHYYHYLYCKHIRDRAEMWRAIAASDSAQEQYFYCRFIKDRPEMRDALLRTNDPQMLYYYCRFVKDREEIWQALANHPDESASIYKGWYCVEILDRPEMRSNHDLGIYELCQRSGNVNESRQDRTVAIPKST